jgi:hypothetical protein
VVSILGFVTLWGDSVSYADDHRPPQVTLKAEGRSQTGRLRSFKWVYRVNDSCTIGSPDLVLSFPSALRVRGDRVAARFLFMKAQSPEELIIQAWTSFDKGTQVLHGHRRFSYVLVPKEEAGQTVSWEAATKLKVRKHLYIQVRAEWPDQEGCSLGNQEATWSFHVKRS